MDRPRHGVHGELVPVPPPVFLGSDQAGPQDGVRAHRYAARMARLGLQRRLRALSGADRVTRRHAGAGDRAPGDDRDLVRTRRRSGRRCRILVFRRAPDGVRHRAGRLLPESGHGDAQLVPTLDPHGPPGVRRLVLRAIRRRLRLHRRGHSPHGLVRIRLARRARLDRRRGNPVRGRLSVAVSRQSRAAPLGQ